VKLEYLFRSLAKAGNFSVGRLSSVCGTLQDITSVSVNKQEPFYLMGDKSTWLALIEPQKNGSRGI